MLRIYMEYMAGGSLAGLIKENPAFAIKISIARQVAEGLQYLHTKAIPDQAIVHLDLKPYAPFWQAIAHCVMLGDHQSWHETALAYHLYKAARDHL